MLRWASVPLDGDVRAVPTTRQENGPGSYIQAEYAGLKADFIAAARGMPEVGTFDAIWRFPL